MASTMPAQQNMTLRGSSTADNASKFPVFVAISFANEHDGSCAEPKTAAHYVSYADSQPEPGDLFCVVNTTDCNLSLIQLSSVAAATVKSYMRVNMCSGCSDAG